MLRLTVVAHPGSRVDRVSLATDLSLDVRVMARPIDGQANAAIENAIAAALGLRPRQVRLASGMRSRRKIVEIDLPDQAALQARLLAYGLRSD
jgi:hypothetical protein